jgi:hypothetical protein
MKSKRTKSLNVNIYIYIYIWGGGIRGITPGALDLNPENNMYSLYVWDIRRWRENK